MEKTIGLKTIKFKGTGKKGRGIFALKDFKKGELIERCPVLTFTPKERKTLEKTWLFHICRSSRICQKARNGNCGWIIW